jgi:hypothetical protein
VPFQVTPAPGIVSCPIEPLLKMLAFRSPGVWVKYIIGSGCPNDIVVKASAIKALREKVKNLLNIATS